VAKDLWLSGLTVVVLASAVGCQPAEKLSSPGDPVHDRERLVEERWPDGSVRISRAVLRDPNGTPINDGPYRVFSANGNPEYEGIYVRGQLHGPERQWHDNGQLRSEQFYRRGLRHGPRRDWDPQGRLRRVESYADDQPDGVWTIWDEDGRIKWQQTFERGKPVR
jgi:hypothetical protein